jgi:hypothetical protein
MVKKNSFRFSLSGVFGRFPPILPIRRKKIAYYFMGLTEQFQEYIDQKKIKIDKHVFILVFQSMVDFFNKSGYEIHYVGKKNVSKQIPKS